MMNLHYNFHIDKIQHQVYKTLEIKLLYTVHDAQLQTSHFPYLNELHQLLAKKVIRHLFA